jgi:hypothetical protein
MISVNERRCNMKPLRPIIGVLVIVIAAFAFQDASITSEIQPLPPSSLSSGSEGNDFTAPLDVNPGAPDITICCSAHPKEAVNENPSPEPEMHVENEEPLSPTDTVEATDGESSNAHFCGKATCYKM